MLFCKLWFIYLLIWTPLDLHESVDIRYFASKKLFHLFVVLYLHGTSQGIVVGIVTRLWNGQSKNSGSITGIPDLGSTQTPIQSVAAPLSLAINR